MTNRRPNVASFGCCALSAICLLSVALFGASGCVGTIEDYDRRTDQGGGAGADAGAASERPDAHAAPGGPETACDDGIDDDGDGAVDCEDSDCALEESCSWPSELRIDIELSFDASSLAELAGYDDCTTRLAADVTGTGEASCATCDRAYRGPYAYLSDDCPEAPRPTQADYALRFASDSQRELYVLDEAGVWQVVGMATGAGGVFTLSRVDPVVVDGTDAGSTTTLMTINEL